MWTSEKRANMRWLLSQQNVKRKKKEASLQKSRTEEFNSSVGWRRKQNLYRRRFFSSSKNSLWLIMNTAWKNFLFPKIETVPPWVRTKSSSFLRRVTFHSRKDKSSLVSLFPNLVLFLPVRPDKLKACPWTNQKIQCVHFKPQEVCCLFVFF